MEYSKEFKEAFLEYIEDMLDRGAEVTLDNKIVELNSMYSDDVVLESHGQKVTIETLG